MKLNNKGWGLKEMMIISSILLLFLLFAAYYIYMLYNNLDTSSASVYGKLELKLQTSAVSYVNKHNLQNSKVIISLDDLQKAGYIDIFTDPNDDACNGYVIYENQDYKSYISCNYYTSFGYNRSYE
ncbi:MAG: hypothetical protein E7167_05520 [Firmicutes bacterium]|nr:hypothetical protein [Bacillota bacterium]